MKILTLIIKQTFFNQILAGTKKQEFREIKSSTEKKYLSYIDKTTGIRYERNDDIPYENEIDVDIIRYDAIQFYVGYHKERDSALIEVVNSEVEYLDGLGFFIFRIGGKLYFSARMVYTLGRVLEKSVK